MSGIISLREASKISGYHQDYLSFLIRKNKLQGQKIGKVWCVKEENLRNFMQEKASLKSQEDLESDQAERFSQADKNKIFPKNLIIAVLLVLLLSFFSFLFFWLKNRDSKVVVSQNTGEFVVNTIYSETNSEISSQTSSRN